MNTMVDLAIQGNDLWGIGAFCGAAIGLSAYFQGKCGACACDTMGETGKGFGNRFGFPDDDQHILVLKDKQATRDAIFKAMKEHLIAKATPDSIVVFHYSGHGSQKVDDNGDEIDGYDEISDIRQRPPGPSPESGHHRR